MADRIVLNTISYHGHGAIENIVPELTARGYKKAFVCSDPDLIKFGVTKKVTDLLDAANFAYSVYSEIKPNPTIANVQDGVAAFKAAEADCIVAIGGDGTFRGAQDLSRFGVSVVGVPGTIDNDIVCTDYTIGFDTAANTAVECIDRLRDTMQSHERCSVVEVMGRHAGYLALYVGVAVGATAVLVPEHQYDFEKHVAEKIRAARLGGKTNFMIVVAEGAASAMDVGKEIKEHLGLDPRVTILGHIQRGGSPTAKDRVLATRMGYEAVRVLAEGMTNRVICVRDDQIVNVDIDEGLAMKKTLNAEEFEVMTVMTGV